MKLAGSHPNKFGRRAGWAIHHVILEDCGSQAAGPIA
jgi:hypothetical protein